MNSPSIRRIPIDLIRPGSFQARRYFDPGALRELAGSIKESGVVSPVVLRSRDAGGFELLAGERRWRAAQLAGLHEIPAIVRDDLSEAEALVVGLIENLQRESLTPMETAAGLKQLGEMFGLTHASQAERRTAYYAHSWGLAHYLASRVSSKEIETYVNDVLSGKDGVAAFERMTGKTCAQVDSELRAYLEAMN